MPPSKTVKRKRSSSLGRGPGPTIKRAVTGVAPRPRPQRIRKPTQKKREADEVEVLQDGEQIDWPLTDVEENEVVEENGVVAVDENNGDDSEDAEFLVISSGEEVVKKASSRSTNVNPGVQNRRNIHRSSDENPDTSIPEKVIVSRKPGAERTSCKPQPDMSKWYRHTCALSKKKNRFIDDEASEAGAEELYERGDFIVSDSERDTSPPPKQQSRKGKEREPVPDHEDSRRTPSPKQESRKERERTSERGHEERETIPRLQEKGKQRGADDDQETLSMLIARNPAVINGVLDIALQDSELHGIYNDLGTEALPSRVTVFVPNRAQNRARPKISHINYKAFRNALPSDVARGQLRGIMGFRQYSVFSNPGHVDPKQFEYFKDCVYIKHPVSGAADVPAVFVMPAVCIKSELNKDFDPDAAYSDSFAKKIYVKTFKQEYRLLEAACGEYTSSSVLHGPLSSEGALIFSTKKKRWARKPEGKAKSAFEDDEDDEDESGPSNTKPRTSLETYPSYLTYNEEVPIYDGLACPDVSHSGFNARPGHMATFQKLPKLNPREVDPESLVMVGFTISKFPVLPETVFPTVFFNVLFVIVVAEAVPKTV
ncbi:hypothetical protein VNI00_018777 [Paramarasmius palmivorus]|uniref:Uncharacterized protein n=1 Tax=Paramarasmius palmivorus TaxID=297713 RepID=A0AAW0AV18_9AGAR